MIYGVTGPSHLALKQWDRAENFIARHLKKGDVLVSGAAHGFDTVGALIAVELGVRLHLVVPDAPHNDALVLQLQNAHGLVKVERMPAVNLPPAEAYMARNDRVVELIRSGELLAGVVKPSGFYRSGEWATINRAVRAGVPVVKEVL